ncbi:hypothetical protein BJ138DRAFT_1183790 [Hygrophoropsis aurantiaca]|uniref:Uncharacterized protein n=1 Tax=Hygrophoropsis aurantiaca TaxID=72124 RepID=A0ACB7ZW70_9AGAM|nr:hypothetical protein BJ138DRAFT_1183790 [Hygrophoropsis aurantiaca]
MYLRFSTVIVTLLLSAFKRCWAQQGASCPASAGYSWAANEIGQDPCVVANDLSTSDSLSCNDIYVSFGPLTAGSEGYPAPSGNTVGPCLCNTVIYSLATACASCQLAQYLSWSQWIVNCPTSDVAQSWPTSIASNTVIPAWAYLAIVNSSWDYAQAYDYATKINQNVNSPSSTATSASTSASSAGPTGSDSGGAGKTSASVGEGPFTGGIVGGVAAVTILVFLGVYFWRRRSQRAYSAEHVEKLYSIPEFHPEFTKLYDPDDPSTFPRTPAPIFQNTENSNGILEVIAGRSQYTGAPEL